MDPKSPGMSRAFVLGYALDMDAPNTQTELPWSEASERNRGPILDALRTRMPARGWVLEIGSGTGQHVVAFAAHFERLSWLPTDRREHLDGLNARIRAQGEGRVLPAVELDVRGAWPDRRFEAVYSANTAHIMSWPEVETMFGGVGRRLRPGGPFLLYGPFNDGGFTAGSNADFDRSLRERDRNMGLREVSDLAALAGRCGLELAEQVAMPANNRLLVFRRTASGSADG